ncbi:MAG: hypothetical protein H6Q90_2347 [Deltaproteobacteria bacterium]|nr:hypothetical protein [Deltaproteobacteria bacterium]
MRTKPVVLLVLALAACGSKKHDGGGGSGSGSADTKPVAVEKAISCPPGGVIKDGACVVVVTPEKLAVVVAQQTRLDDLAKLLDKIDTVAAPIELLNAFRKLDEWKTLTAKFEKLKTVDEVVTQLDVGVKTLRMFKGGLGEASGRLGNLNQELGRLMKDTGASRKIEEVRAQVSSEVRSTVEPLAAQVTDTIQNGLTPLTLKLDEVSAVIELTCATARLSGAGPSTKELCKQARDVFAKGIAYLEDFKARPAQVFDELAKSLETELDQLIDSQSKQLIDLAQTKVNQALNLPAGSGSGSGSAK